jgi:hypothetical protein
VRLLIRWDSGRRRPTVGLMAVSAYLLVVNSSVPAGERPGPAGAAI